VLARDVEQRGDEMVREILALAEREPVRVLGVPRRIEPVPQRRRGRDVLGQIGEWQIPTGPERRGVDQR